MVQCISAHESNEKTKCDDPHEMACDSGGLLIVFCLVLLGAGMLLVTLLALISELVVWLAWLFWCLVCDRREHQYELMSVA